MKKGTKLFSYKNDTKNAEITVYNKPEFVYIPLVNGSDKDITLLVKKGDIIKNDINIGINTKNGIEKIFSIYTPPLTKLIIAV